MCLATPSKVIKIKNGWAIVRSGDHNHKVKLDLLADVKIGDYLLVHDDLAINKLPKQEAKKIIQMIDNHTHEITNH